MLFPETPLNALDIISGSRNFLTSRIFFRSISMSLTSVFKKLLEPLNSIFNKNPFSRKCSGINDFDFIKLGLHRVFGSDKSGRAFLQRLMLEDISAIEPTHFFKSLKSERRLGHLKHLCQETTKEANRLLKGKDPFIQFKELNDFEIYASDGSYHKWACHDTLFDKTEDADADRKLKHDSTKRQCQHFYSRNGRTHTGVHLTSAIIGGERQKEHDMHALKRLESDKLRLGAPKGMKVLHIYDRAGIDFKQWHKWKNNNGIYFLSIEKKGCVLEVLKEHTFDKLDNVNNGVLSDQKVKTSDGSVLRRVTYICPDSQKTYIFLTNLPFSIRSGLIPYLYKTRWDVEKMFDVFKNKLEEKKSWATSDTAKTMQATFICLAHNLSLILNHKIEEEEGTIYKYDAKRKNDNLNVIQNDLKMKKTKYPSMWKTCLRCSQITIKFYRWLRVHLVKEALWCNAIRKLEVLYCEN